MGRTPGLALDCAGLLIAAARRLLLVAPDFDVPAYERQPDGHSMMSWTEQYMTRITYSAMQPGDAIVTSVEKDPQHLGILGDYWHGGLSLIHATQVAAPPRVIETRLMFSRRQRFVAAYSFKGAE